MKGIEKLFKGGLVFLVALFILFASGVVSFARITGTPPASSSPDRWCVGPSSYEVCVTFAGNFIPTTNGTQALGTSSLQFSNVEAAAINSGGGALAIGGAGTVTLGASASDIVSSGRRVMTKTVVGSGAGVGGVFASTTVPVSSSYETVISSGLLILMTSLPNISTSTVSGGTTELTSGTELLLTSTAAVGGLIFQDAGTLAGSQLQLGAATRQVSQYKTLRLVYDATDHMWREISYGNN